MRSNTVYSFVHATAVFADALIALCCIVGSNKRPASDSRGTRNAGVTFSCSVSWPGSSTVCHSHAQGRNTRGISTTLCNIHFQLTRMYSDCTICEYWLHIAMLSVVLNKKVKVSIVGIALSQLCNHTIDSHLCLHDPEPAVSCRHSSVMWVVSHTSHTHCRYLHGI